VSKVTEKQLDKALQTAFSFPEFANWFLSKTKFHSSDAAYRWSRSDHPWSMVPLTLINTDTGASEEITKGSETDVLVIFENSAGKTIALHIENKLRRGKFTPLQPEFYRKRAQQWLHNPKYGSYSDYEIVLTAPQEFYDRNQEECKKFPCFISHEDIAAHLPGFGA
jgi:hypothetical protein